MTILRATYRLQLNKDFPFESATALVPYLSTLGISHVYLSPILAAQPGSSHGYDTIDHTRLNSELGTEAEFRTLVDVLRSHDMGVIVDFVPNHMGVGGAHNRLWLDVLRHGSRSVYADWFDIDWTPPRADLQGKLLIPFLGSSYAEAREEGHITLKAETDGLSVWAYDKEKLPIRPEDQAELLERYGSPMAAVAATHGPTLDALVDRQHWRLAHFMTGYDDLNYRRFFINSELAGIRIDRPEVFQHAHALIFGLIDQGLIDGLRLDHIDGLLDPTGYLKTLKAKLPRDIPVWVEKILAPHEQLRDDWPVTGTTGYEFGSQLTRLLTNEAAEPKLTALYQAFTGDIETPAEQAYAGKKRVMETELAAELSTLSGIFAGLAHSIPATADLTQHTLERTLREVLASLSVYRTYIDDSGAGERDRRELALAFERARRMPISVAPAVFDFIGGVLTGELSSQYDPHTVKQALGKFQQLSGPVMAKGLEDTALYRFNRLVSLNEVGAHPDIFSLSVEAFHDANLQRLRHHPDCLLGTSTHDTKRGEDTRAIIAAISDHPDLWAEAVSIWQDLLPSHQIHPNDLYLFFQQLLGAWPVSGSAEGISDRLTEAMTKALREARLRSAWGLEDTNYEKAVSALIDSALSDQSFLEEFHRLRAPFVETGRRKGLIQQAIKLTVPGIPDIYRGAEDWEQSLVDPDNRRALDFESLAHRLAASHSAKDEKLLLTKALLGWRAQHPVVFRHGRYEPVCAGHTSVGYLRSDGTNKVALIADLSAGHLLDAEATRDQPDGLFSSIPVIDMGWLKIWLS